MDSQRQLLFIVESETPVRNALRMLMIFMDWDVRTYESPADCLPDALKHKPSCILCDLSQATKHALMLQWLLRKQGFAVPIVALTEHVDPDLAEVAYASGITEVLDKPSAARTLHTVIHRALKSKAATGNRTMAARLDHAHA
jgi:FixJ family two-component response regulator